MSFVDTLLRGSPRRWGEGRSVPRPGRRVTLLPGGGGPDRERRPRRPRRWARWVVALAVAPFLFLGVIVVLLAAGGSEPEVGPSAAALSDIPGDFLALYQQAAGSEGLDWAVLAGIGKLECDHGRSQLAGCAPEGTVNGAGARGPMQFLGSTWRGGAGQFDRQVAGPPVPVGEESRGYATDGDGDGVADPWTPADAIHAAARYLRVNGAPDDYRSAVWAYNHSDSYVSQVLRWADSYREAAENPAQGAVNEVPDGPVALAEVRGITVNSAIAGPLEGLLAAAERDGVSLTGWGYRSGAEQIELRRQHCGTSYYAMYEMSSSQCSPPTARPGTSMHEQGLAVDFEDCSSRSTACYQWLAGNASRFGFYNLPSEPWHWSIDGS